MQSCFEVCGACQEQLVQDSWNQNCQPYVAHVGHFLQCSRNLKIAWLHSAGSQRLATATHVCSVCRIKRCIIGAERSPFGCAEQNRLEKTGQTMTPKKRLHPAVTNLQKVPLCLSSQVRICTWWMIIWIIMSSCPHSLNLISSNSTGDAHSAQHSKALASGKWLDAFCGMCWQRSMFGLGMHGQEHGFIVSRCISVLMASKERA